VGHNFSYTTPNIIHDDVNINPLSAGFNPLGHVITPNWCPGVSISADLGNGPGIREVATFSVDVDGPHGKVAVSNAHGTVTGAAGGLLLRPFAAPGLQIELRRHRIRRAAEHERACAKLTSRVPSRNERGR
jgi:hypothetical protein